ncbi:hypothetical protein FZ103_15565 [Streptomonospora sp. PA3]|uniref:hypothetical protein n=1 Tax=Streptomonospora sp. PA3 TaxID=2607326 RepID=UPI0012DDD804|nr:hypothetical protein [Streptomonospora sp. PA3]MUL42574.1 hypothetical protein [Streptomonospora sp. PA3]
MLKRSLRRFAVAVSAAAFVLGLTAVPAAAHTLHEAVVSSDGCGWGGYDYRQLEGNYIRTTGGTKIGRVDLLWSSKGDNPAENCVVTRRWNFLHGVEGYAAANLLIKGRRNRWDSGWDYSHYAAVAAPAQNRCVGYWGKVQNIRNNDIRGNGDKSWNYCD